MDELGTVTVDCLNAATCGGAVEIRLSRDVERTDTGAVTEIMRGDRQSQTCRCNYSDEEVNSLLNLARVKLGVI